MGLWRRIWIIMLAAAGLSVVVAPGAANAAIGNSSIERPTCLTALPANGDVAAFVIEAERLAERHGCAQGPGSSAVADSASRKSFRMVLGEADTAPRYFISRTAMFDRLTLVVRDADGNWQSESHDFANLQGTFFDRQFYAQLPETDASPELIYAVFDGATQRILVDFAWVSDELPGKSDGDRDALILIALALGLIAMPLLFDTVFFRVLREPFIVWHGIFVSAMTVHLGFSSGILNAPFDLDLYTLRVLMVGSFGIIVVAAMQFAITFVEPETMKRRHRRAIDVISVATLGATALHMAGLTSLGPIPAYIFYGTGALTGMVYCYIVIAALRAGSRAILFPLVGFGPLICVAGMRVVTFAMPGLPTVDFSNAFIMAAALEVAVTAIGVANRFMELKNDRDRATSDAEMLEKLADQDPLTGLMNRRAIQPSFSQLYTRGFTSFALLDLDRFKSVNDQFGHGVGDDVLRATAQALAPDDDTYAIRMGGEEFMLLLRGDDTYARVEARRQAITRLVAHEVPGLDRPVTASAGFVQFPGSGGERFSFEATYAHIDRLLYEAKSTGRNRMVSEKMRVFEGGKPSDRRKDSRTKAA